MSAVVPGRTGRGVKLSALLQRARPRDGAAHVSVRSQDGRFEASQPLESMMTAVVVYELGGGPLAVDQGGPFRLLIPGALDPCANVKQVGRIEVSSAPGSNTCPHTAEEHAKLKR